MRLFFLQREKAFVNTIDHPSIASLKNSTRVLLQRAADKAHAISGPPRFHRFIDDRMHKHCEELGVVSADHWLAAKRQLGYPLTPKQEATLTAYRARKVREQRVAA